MDAKYKKASTPFSLTGWELTWQRLNKHYSFEELQTKTTKELSIAYTNLINEQISENYAKECQDYREDIRAIMIAAHSSQSKNMKHPPEPKKPYYYFFDAEKYKKTLLNG